MGKSAVADDLNRIAKPYDFVAGSTPLLISMPHSGLALTAEVAAGLTNKARSLPDTDWHVPELYSFLEDLGAGCIRANYSRYVIDLNRPLDDEPLYQSRTTGLFPDILFDGTPVFSAENSPDSAHRESCKRDIWQAYHGQIAKELARIKSSFGYAVLFDAHSIASRVPMLFSGKLPDFNLGSNDGAACAANLILGAAERLGHSKYNHVINGRFKGGYITRSFGVPEQGIHAIQLELSQDTYMDETKPGYHLDKDKFSQVKPVLKQLLDLLITTVPET